MHFLSWLENRITSEHIIFQIFWVFYENFIPVFNFTILVVLILTIPLLDKPKPTWIPSNYPGYEWNTPGLDTLPSEKTTLSGTSINYSFNAFGIGYTTSTLTIDDSVWS